jgi:hypothetical protein
MTSPTAPSGPSRLPQHLFVHEQCQRCDSTDTVLVPLCREHYVGPAEVADGPSRLRELLTAHFDISEASPLQHYGSCNYWRNKPCNCVMAQIQEAFDEGRPSKRTL